MADLNDLAKEIFGKDPKEMTDEELEAHVKAIRSSRRTPPEKSAKPKKEASLPDVGELSEEEKQRLLKVLLGG